MSIYDHEKNLKRVEKRIREAEYSEKNKANIFRFENYLFAKGLTTVRVLKYLSQINIISRELGIDFEDATKDDIERYVASVERSKKAAWTKKDYKQCLKRFYKWMNGDEEEHPLTKWISLKMQKNTKKLPEELLNQEEVMRMIEVARNSRDRAMAACWYDGGARVGESGNLKLKHVIFDQYGVVVMVGKEDGKTGMRRVRLVFSAPYLAEWINDHPDKNNPNAYLWINLGTKNYGAQMKYDSIRRAIIRLAERANIEKRVFNHLFRHSRATELAEHLTQAQMEDHLGWIHGSDMPEIYIHMSGKQLDEPLLKMAGIIKEEDESKTLKPVICTRCKTMNGPTCDFCSSCGMALTIEASKSIEKRRSDISMALMELVEKDPEVAKVLRGVIE
ncbi:tyrosine-type recombinase/integrase [Methanolobus sp. ZRKC5]|uniref:tyrosine-type recombinase/integrase n=1 Tax=unclassified Methanolobus TaxID=2629569 RepID=UPI00313E63C9